MLLTCHSDRYLLRDYGPDVVLCVALVIAGVAPRDAEDLVERLRTEVTDEDPVLEPAVLRLGVA